MTTASRNEKAETSSDETSRRRLVLLASAATFLTFLHFVDHAIRGELVVDRGLNPLWNHSGWPFDTTTDKAYLFPLSFVVVLGLLLGGIYFTRRGKLWAGFWLGTSITLAVYLLYVHFVGFSSGAAETPSVIAMSHDVSVLGVAALIVLFGLIAVFLALAVQAGITRQRSGRW